MKLKLNEARILTVCGVRLYPGINQVEDGVGEQILAHPLLKTWLDKGRLEAIKSTTLRPGDIAEIYDVKLLRELASTGTKKIKASAAKQLQKIDKMSVSKGA